MPSLQRRNIISHALLHPKALLICQHVTTQDVETLGCVETYFRNEYHVLCRTSWSWPGARSCIFARTKSSSSKETPQSNYLPVISAKYSLETDENWRRPLTSVMNRTMNSSEAQPGWFLVDVLPIRVVRAFPYSHSWPHKTGPSSITRPFVVPGAGPQVKAQQRHEYLEGRLKLCW